MPKRHGHPGSRLAPYESLAAQTGASLRTIVALAAANRIDILFNHGVLRRIDKASPLVAQRYLADRQRGWERRGDVIPFPGTSHGHFAPENVCGCCGFSKDGGVAGSDLERCAPCGAYIPPPTTRSTG
jgi:hypothetical protein